MIPTFVAIRMKPNLSFESANAQALAACQAKITNEGTTSITFQLNQTNDISVGGTRTAIGSPITLVPGGVKIVDLQPTQAYVEVLGQGSNSGRIFLELSTRITWDLQAFDKKDATYSSTLWTAAP